jgi:maltooligosyltrehalose trehalohydrolase
VRMLGERGEAVLLAHFGREELTLSFPWPAGRWRQRLDSAAAHWQGPGSATPPVIGTPEITLNLSPWSVLLYLREDSF